MFSDRERFLRSVGTPNQNNSPSFGFIDVDNVRKSLNTILSDLAISEEDAGDIEFHRLFQNFGHHRCYAYAATEDERSKPKDVVDLERTDGFIVKLGKLTKKGKKIKQQGVDVQLAIDATKLAYSGVMKSATLYAGDGDFLPLVQAVADSGTQISVASFANPEKGEVAPSLRASADRYVWMNKLWIYEALKRERSTVRMNPDVSHRWQATKHEQNFSTTKNEFEIFRLNNEFAVKLDNSPLPCFTSHKLDDLKLWLQLEPFVEPGFSHLLHS
ncbi:NYN domain-containing protein [uncultured Tateyamaria sp.]|uniref:NYN domain-containing protein n=1 Tax=uncultured Tateyamaria sp. TaxID=455651 RepID=UPI00260E63DE|nr:NYN domain-containing protein [uncultured Tateyamaria sp.]